MTHSTYPIGTPGKQWNHEDKAHWLACQSIKRSYQQEVVTLIDELKSTLEVQQYGELNYATGSYPLYALKTTDFDTNKATVEYLYSIALASLTESSHSISRVCASSAGLGAISISF